MSLAGRRETARRLRGDAAPDAGRWRRQQRAGRRWAAWGLALGALLGAATQAPAQWLADALQQATGGRLLLAQAEGSVWQGSAVPVLTGGPGSRDAAALPGRLHWQLSPGWRGLRLTATQACCLSGELQATLSPRWDGWALTLDTRSGHPGAAATEAQPLGRWPASWLSGLGTPWNTLQLGGVLQLSSPGFSVQSAQGRLQVAGALVLELRDTGSRLSPLPVLGSYRLLLDGGAPATAAPAGTPPAAAGHIAQLRLDTLDAAMPSALRLSGSGQWSGNRLRFLGQAEAAPGQDGPLSNLLNIIGRRQGALSVISIG